MLAAVKTAQVGKGHARTNTTTSVGSAMYSNAWESPTGTGMGPVRIYNENTLPSDRERANRLSTATVTREKERPRSRRERKNSIFSQPRMVRVDNQFRHLMPVSPESSIPGGSAANGGGGANRGQRRRGSALFFPDSPVAGYANMNDGGGASAADGAGMNSNNMDIDNSSNPFNEDGSLDAPQPLLQQAVTLPSGRRASLVMRDSSTFNPNLNRLSLSLSSNNNKGRNSAPRRRGSMGSIARQIFDDPFYNTPNYYNTNDNCSVVTGTSAGRRASKVAATLSPSALSAGVRSSLSRKYDENGEEHWLPQDTSNAVVVNKLVGDFNSSRLSRTIGKFIMFLIVLSTLNFILETLPQSRLDTSVKLYFDTVEMVCNSIFTVEYLTIFISSILVRPKGQSIPSFCFHYVLGFFSIVDLLAILPWYLETFLLKDVEVMGTAQAKMTTLTVFKILRVGRIFRIFKLGEFYLL